MEQDKKLYTLIIFSENLPGLLNHVASVFTRRQVNIETLNVSASSIEGIHRYTITCFASEDIIKKITKQIERMIDVIQANYFTSDEIYVRESALFKLSTPALLGDSNISKAIRQHDAYIVEVNPTYSIVSIEGMTEDIISLFRRLKQLDCILQFVRSGAIAVTRSRREQLTEFLDEREKSASRNHKKN